MILLASVALGGGYARLDLQRGSELRVGWMLPAQRSAVLVGARGSGRQAELNLGFASNIGALSVAGWWAGGVRFPTVVPYTGPGLTLAFEAPPIPVYLESWTEWRVGRPFGGSFDELLKRDILLVPIRQAVSIGAQVEPLWRFPGGLESVHVGPRLAFGFGTDAAAGFIGWDARSRSWLGRVSVTIRFEDVAE